MYMIDIIIKYQEKGERLPYVVNNLSLVGCNLAGIVNNRLYEANVLLYKYTDILLYKSAPVIYI